LVHRFTAAGAYKDGPEISVARPLFCLARPIRAVQNFLARPLLQKKFMARPDKLPYNKQLGFFNFWTPSLILNFKFSLENFINNYINSNARRFLNFYALKWQASRCSKFDVFEKFRKRIFSTFSFCIGASKVCQSHIELFSLSKLVANATNIQQRE